MSPRHMNHPGRSDVSCALDEMQPSASGKAQITTDGKKGSWYVARNEKLLAAMHDYW